MTATPSSPPGSDARSSRRRTDDVPWWLYPAILLAAIAITALLARRTDHLDPVVEDDQPTELWTPAAMPVGETVRLAIDFGNGARRTFAALPWQDDMTVADLMQAARAFKPAIRYEQRGEADRAFLESLEGVAGGGADSRNWLYRVNGVHANESFGVRKLQPGDAVLWIYDFGE